MSLPDRNTLVYAGIGSRQTPAATLNDMTTMSAWLARNGWHLSSGGADGGDKAFALGANSDERTVYLPWSGYNKLSGPNCITREGACENGGRERGCRSGMLHDRTPVVNCVVLSQLKTWGRGASCATRARRCSQPEPER